jgi:glycolate oxidase iron-sulfur subunit
MHLRFPVAKMDPRRVLPELSRKFFLETAPEESRATAETDRVALFAGCSMNYLYPQVGEASLRVLARRGVSVLLPREQKCCGLPAWGSGDVKSARKLALANVKAFEAAGTKTTLVACGSCGAHLKEQYPKLFEEADPAIRQRVQRFSDSVMDITVYLAAGLGEERPRSSDRAIRVTYHDSCHLNRKLHVTEEPRALLRSVAELVENDMADRCCGMGGSYGLENFELSAKMLARKMDSIEKTGADVIATGCMGCLMQMQQGVHDRHLDMKAAHVIQVVDEAEAASKPVS